MTGRDLLENAFGNLWRMKLRSSLTVAGVVIAIAAFTAMLSFGAGGKKYVDERFEEFGLFSTMRVFPNKTPNGEGRKLDEEAAKEIAAIPGVRTVYPIDAFQVTAYFADTMATVDAQVIPLEATYTKAFEQLRQGTLFSSDTASQVIVSEDFLRKIGRSDADSVLGKNLILEAHLARIDSGIVKILKIPPDTLRERIKRIDPDSLFKVQYTKRLLFREMADAVTRFIDGLLNDRATVRDTLTICGIMPSSEHTPLNIRPLLITNHTAQRLNQGNIISDPKDLLYGLATGTLTQGRWDFESKVYPRMTLDVDPKVPYSAITDSIEALGFSVFSFAREFEEMQRFFLFFDLGLAGIGLIALITASLGIANTLIMSILERRREIGVLKALGADDRDVRIMFLVEAGTIGLVGAALGVVFGWLITRLISEIGQAIMRARDVPPVDLFALPLWLIGLGIGFGVLVSLIAGYYPAMRAAKLDPVTALRDE